MYSVCLKKKAQGSRFVQFCCVSWAIGLGLLHWRLDNHVPVIMAPPPPPPPPQKKKKNMGEQVKIIYSELNI